MKKGSLVKWIHEDVPTNLCVVVRQYLQEDIEFLIGPDEEVEDNPLFLLYDFVLNEYFYAHEEELLFL
tara:strand:+ start:2455 stop:2658 length:204 start_codon:yes stop_codon:yes gene_type:complete